MWISTGSPGGSRPITKCEAISGTSDGFTLLETLVAFAIVVVVLMSVLPAISGAVRGSSAVVVTRRLREGGVSALMQLSERPLSAQIRRAERQGAR